MVTESQPGDGLQLLARDHRKVEELFARYEKASGASAKQKIVQEICTELKIHTMIEEEIYYPRVRSKSGADDMLDKAETEHERADERVAHEVGAGVSDVSHDRDPAGGVEHQDERGPHPTKAGILAGSPAKRRACVVDGPTHGADKILGPDRTVVPADRLDGSGAGHVASDVAT